jgi:hypothetical protein
MNLVHWRHYLALEREFSNISQYVEICEDNYRVHSIKFAHLLMAASSEFETVGGMIRERFGKPKSNIHGIIEVLEKPYMCVEVDIPIYGVRLKPFEGCGLTASPVWWRAYNNVKHQRVTHFNEANLYNSLMSICGLLVALVNYYHLERKLLLKNDDIKISSVLSELQGSIDLFQLPSDWYSEW